MKQCARVVCFAICLGALRPQEAAAGPYSDELSKCLVRSTTTAEKNTLIKWIFAAAALHPEVKGIASITTEQRDELSKSTGKMVEHLVSESCKSEVTDAMKYEGPGALGASFQVLGQVAAMGLFSDPSVSSFMRDFTKYVDVRKVQGLAPPK
jgi:hypothetical protein